MEVERASRDDVFEASRMPTIEKLLREKRLRWFRHLMREDDDEPAKQMLSRETEHNSKWFQLLTSDLPQERYSKKGSIFGVRQINLENVEFCEV